MDATEEGYGGFEDHYNVEFVLQVLSTRSTIHNSYYRVCSVGATHLGTNCTNDVSNTNDVNNTNDVSNTNDVINNNVVSKPTIYIIKFCHLYVFARKKEEFQKDITLIAFSMADRVGRIISKTRSLRRDLTVTLVL